MTPQNCPYCREVLETKMVLEYKVAQFFCIDTMMCAEVPKVYGHCSRCLNQITYTTANFYTLYYLDIFKELMGKVYAAKKEM